MKKLSLIMVMMMAIMPFGAAADDYVRGDVDQDGTVGISDVTSLVDYLLSQEWQNGPYDEGYWIVINTTLGEEYYLLEDKEGICNHCKIFTVMYPVFLYSCQFHFRINGVDYGPQFYMTETDCENPYQNPLKPGKNNCVIKVEDEPWVYTFGVVKDEDTNSYYAYVRKGILVHP